MYHRLWHPCKCNVHKLNNFLGVDSAVDSLFSNTWVLHAYTPRRQSQYPICIGQPLLCFCDLTKGEELDNPFSWFRESISKNFDIGRKEGKFLRKSRSTLKPQLQCYVGRCNDTLLASDRADDGTQTQCQRKLYKSLEIPEALSAEDEMTEVVRSRKGKLDARKIEGMDAGDDNHGQQLSTLLISTVLLWDSVQILNFSILCKKKYEEKN